MKRSIAAALLVALLGCGILWQFTEGFRIYTSEGARRAAIQRAPRAVPAVLLEDQDGNVFGFQELQGKLVAVEFIYTHCTTLCSALGLSFQRVRASLPTAALGRDVMLLSISFDPQRDSPAQMKGYAQRFGADGHAWRIARVNTEADLRLVLETFGITVIPDEFGGFEHNAALHLVDGSRRLVEIWDYDKPLQFAAQLRKRI